jgi:hemolysin activation/secretion protein
MAQFQGRMHARSVVRVAACWALCADGAGVLAAEVTPPGATATAAAETQARFDVFELRVLGNTRLRESEIDQVLIPFLGPGRALADVEAARQALETRYHERGFGTVFVDIPEQSVESGLVRLHVTESTLGRVSVTGERYFSGRQIRAAIPEAARDTTPALPVLQAQIAAVNAQSRDRQVTPVLKAGSRVGTVDLNLKVEDHLPLHASLELNNQYTVDTEPLRAIAGLSYENLFGRLDTLSAQYQTAPQNRSQVDVWTVSYATHLFHEHARLAAYYFRSNSAVATLGSGDASLTVLGKGSVSGLRLIVPLPATSTSLETVTLGADYKNFLQEIGGSSGGTQTRLLTPITYVNLSAGYSGGWRLPRAQTAVTTTANFGVRGVQNDPLEFENSHFLAPPNYFYVRANGMADWQFVPRLRLHIAASGQYSAAPIISNEQFSIAGADGVRGYLEAESLGDRGFKASLQLAPPQWPMFGGRLSVESFLFFDYGHVGLVRPLPGEQGSIDLRSAGAGLELTAFGHFNASLVWAEPLRTTTQTRRGASRLLFSTKATW